MTTTTKSIQTNQRIAGGLWGLLIGDALGVPYEFHPPESIPPLEQIEMTPPDGFARTYAGLPPGTWSDDGAQALALLDSLLSQGRLDLTDLGMRLVDWYEHGAYAVDHNVFDVGNQTRTAIQALKRGVPAPTAGPLEERHNGNGSLMRVLPLALWHTGSDAELVHDAQIQSMVTHGHLRSQVCCAVYCLWARRLLHGEAQAWESAVSALRTIYADDQLASYELEQQIRPDDEPQGTGGGYVLDCLQSARIALHEPDYEAVVKRAIAFGNDTDTTACVAGGLAGIRDGVEAIPQRWMDALRGKDLPERLLQTLLKSTVS